MYKCIFQNRSQHAVWWSPRSFSTMVDMSTNKLIGNLKASEHFDLVVIGSGPAAQKCAIDSSKRGKKTAVVDKRAMLGGVCIHTGTIPSKTFREAIIHTTAYRHKSFYEAANTARHKIGIRDLLTRVQMVEKIETDITRDQLLRNGVELIHGSARFLPDEQKKTIAVLSNDKYESSPTDAQRHNTANICKRVLTADKFLIACGTRPARRPDIPFDGKTIFDSDQILWGGISTIPKRLIVVGAGVIGMEYASMISIIPGTQVTVIDGRPHILDMADKEVSDALCYSMRESGARFLTGETLKSVKKENANVIVELMSGKTIVGDAMLYALGRTANTEGLNLGAVGISVSARGLLTVDENFQTATPHIYAAGDCIGYPALASTSMEQGRLASVHMWTFGDNSPMALLGSNEQEFESSRDRTRLRSGRIFPFGIYTIPEISMVGKSEQALTAENIPYEVGIARYEELAKGQMLGGAPGFLKIIFCPNTLKLLGVHAFGEGATEIIHIGQVVMSSGGTLEYFRNAVFNYPTLAEAYRVAALIGLRKVENLRSKSLQTNNKQQ